MAHSSTVTTRQGAARRLLIGCLLASTRAEAIQAQTADRAQMPAAIAGAQVVLPFEYEDTRLYVPVGVGGQVRWFILDTGAQPTVLDEHVAMAAGVAGRDTTTTTGAGGGRTRRSTGSEIALALGRTTMTVRQPAIAPLDSLLSRYTGSRAPGIIGSQFFVGRAVTIDFDQHIVIARATPDASELANSLVLPLEIDGGIPYLTGTLRLPDGRAVTARLLVDLGAKSTLLLAEPFIERAKLGALQASGVRSSLGAGMGGATRYSFVRLRSLELGSAAALHLDSAVVGLSVAGTLRSTYYDGLLGAEFLQRYRVTFDYPGKRLILRLRSPAPPNLDFDMSGMFVVAQGDDLREFAVADVAPGSAAASAGMSVGDRIATVDGREAPQMTLSAVRTLLRGPAGRRVVVEALRGGERRTATIVLARRV